MQDKRVDNYHKWNVLAVFLISLYFCYEYVGNADGALQRMLAYFFLLVAVATNISFLIKANWAWKVVAVYFVLFFVNFFVIDHNIAARAGKIFGALFEAALHFK